MRVNYQKFIKLFGAGLLFILSAAMGNLTTAAGFDDRNIEITTNFTDRIIAPDEKIELRLSRALTPEEGTLAVVLNDTDLTALFVGEMNSFSYTPKFSPYPAGENKLTVYSVNRNGEWTRLKEFSLRVAAATAETGETRAENEKTEKSEGGTRVEFTPVLNLNVKGENNVLFFPETARPERLRYADTSGQGGFQLKILRKGWSFGAQFDFAGSSREGEALRFGELGNNASQIDLSSYQAELSKGRFKAQLGHVSFGSQRHLINGFSSRGLVVTLPAGKQNEISLTTVNGTSIVGFDNFTGLSRAQHQVSAVTFAREFIKERPGGLRLEFTAMRGSLLPLNSFNERNVKDAEKSFGGAIRLQFKDKKERFRLESGFTRSRFTNPADPSLEQGFSVIRVQAETRNARFLEASLDFLQGLKLFDDRSLKVTGTYRHEEIEPLFRSVVASTQADRRQNQFEVAASFGDVNFTYGNLRDRNNLGDIPTILKTLTRRHNMIFSASTGTLFNPSKPKNSCREFRTAMTTFINSAHCCPSAANSPTFRKCQTRTATTTVLTPNGNFPKNFASAIATITLFRTTGSRGASSPIFPARRVPRPSA